MTKTNLRVFKLLASVSALLASWSCSAIVAQIIPPDRMTDWTPGVTVGVPGGIPTDRDCRLDVTKAPYHADNTGVADSQPAIQRAIAGAALPKSLYLTDKPAWFGDLPWPPFGPDTHFERNNIPAQVRFEAIGNTISAPSRK